MYAVALQFFSVVTVAASAFQLAYGPFAFARAGSAGGAGALRARVLARLRRGRRPRRARSSPVRARGARRAGAADAYRPPPRCRRCALAFAAVALGAYTVASVGIGIALRTPLLVWCAAAAASRAGDRGPRWFSRHDSVRSARAAHALGYAAVGRADLPRSRSASTRCRTGAAGSHAVSSWRWARVARDRSAWFRPALPGVVDQAGRSRRSRCCARCSVCARSAARSAAAWLPPADLIRTGDGSKMCGIAGTLHPRRPRSTWPACIAMSRLLRHRGPDDEGIALFDPTSGAR